MKKLLPALVVLMLSACGTTTTVTSEQLANPIPKGYARLIVERDKSLLYAGGAATIRVNGEQIASLGVGGSVAHDVKVGTIIMEASTPTAPGRFVMRFDAAPGKTYNLLVSPRDGQLLFGAAFGLIGDTINASVSEQSGYFQIAPKGGK